MHLVISPIWYQANECLEARSLHMKMSLKTLLVFGVEWQRENLSDEGRYRPCSKGAFTLVCCVYTTPSKS
jgi:hypothetical protein